MGKITGNKGEWSELYVLLHLLATGKLYAADKDLNKLENIFFPILKILRNDSPQKNVVYELPAQYTTNTDILKQPEVLVYVNNQFVCSVKQSELDEEQRRLYQSIVNGPGRAFGIDSAEQFMKKLHCEKIKAGSSDKTDITMEIHDINTGYNPVCGFSIKSDLGNAPTLLNASEATNFVYKVSGLTASQAEEINAIDTKAKILDRITAIYNKGATLEFIGLKNQTFNDNLIMIDSMMQEMLSHIVLYSYKTGKINCADIIRQIDNDNPMNYPRSGLYSYKFKKFLCAVALGLMPSKVWNGYDEANGGYIIVKNNGDVVAYHIYNRNSFEDYLLNNTKFERGSTSRHKFATIYEHDGELYINLNLQIRFI